MAERAHCVDCFLQAPEDKDASLISAFGWRLTRSRLQDGSLSLEWRCPPCWQRLKATRGPAGNTMRPPSAGTPAPGADPLASRGGRRPA